MEFFSYKKPVHCLTLGETHWKRLKANEAMIMTVEILAVFDLDDNYVINWDHYGIV